MTALEIIGVVGWLLAILAACLLTRTCDHLYKAARTNQELLVELQRSHDSIRFWIKMAKNPSDEANEAIKDLAQAIEQYGRN